MPLSFLLHLVPPFEADCLSRNTLSEFNFLRPDKERDVKQKTVESKRYIKGGNKNGKLHCLRISPEISLLRAEGFQVPAWRGLRQKVGVFRSTSGLGGQGGWEGGVWEVLIDAPCRAVPWRSLALLWRERNKM